MEPSGYPVDHTDHEFQSQGGFIIVCTILLLAYNDPQSHLWFLGLGIKPGSLALEANTIPLRQPNTALNHLGTASNPWFPHSAVALKSGPREEG